MPRTSPEPNWQPLAQIPTIAWAINGMADSAEAQKRNLAETATRPGVLDDSTLHRLTAAFSQQKGDLWLYVEQLRRWRRERLTPAQDAAIALLEQRLATLTADVTAILDMAEQQRGQTIEAILNRNPGELALDIITGKRSPPGERKPR